MQEEQALLPRLSQAQQASFNDVHAMTPGLASLRQQQAALDAMTAQRDGEEQERAERIDAVDQSLAAGNVHKHLKTYNLSIVCQQSQPSCLLLLSNLNYSIQVKWIVLSALEYYLQLLCKV